LASVGLPLLPLVPVLLHKRAELGKTTVAIMPVYVLGLAAASKGLTRGLVFASALLIGSAVGFDPDPVVGPLDIAVAITLGVIGVSLFVVDQFRSRIVRGEG